MSHTETRRLKDAARGMGARLRTYARSAATSPVESELRTQAQGWLTRKGIRRKPKRTPGGAA